MWLAEAVTRFGIPMQQGVDIDAPIAERGAGGDVICAGAAAEAIVYPPTIVAIRKSAGVTLDNGRAQE